MIYKRGDILLNKYRLDTLVGQGAFAQVWKATHLELNITRALKILRRETPGVSSVDFDDFQKRFRLEAQIGAKVDHPNLVRVHDFEQSGDTLILVMEYAPNGNLSSRISRSQNGGNTISIERAIQITLEVAQGLSALHAHDIVHRDLKPSNIVFGKDEVVKITDFGLAQMPGGPGFRSQMSRPALHPGTPGYMSPEQASTHGYLHPSSDIYSLGLILFEMLTGRNYNNVKPGITAASLRSDVPVWLDRLLSQMLNPDPQKRPWDGEAIVSHILDERNRKQTTHSSLQQFYKNAKRPIILLGILLTLALAVSVIYTLLVPDKPLSKLIPTITSVTDLDSQLATPSLTYTQLPVNATPVINLDEPTKTLAFPSTQLYLSPTPYLTSTDTPKPTNTNTLPIPVILPTYTPSPTITRTLPPPVIPPTNTPSPTPTSTQTRNIQGIAFVTNRDGNEEIYWMAADGSMQENLTNNRATDGHPSWSPDGSRLAFHSDRQDGDFEIYSMSVNGSELRRLTNSPGWDGQPEWSPNGRYIAFESARNGAFEVFIMNSDGSNTYLIPNSTNGGYPTWSPDGSQIAFSMIRDDNRDIYICNLDGGNLRRLTDNTAEDWMPRWSPDGSYIIYSSNINGNFDLFRINVDGSNLKQLTFGSSNEWWPVSWSSSREQIAYTVDTYGSWDIFFMSSSGQELLRLTDSSANDLWPACQP